MPDGMFSDCGGFISCVHHGKCLEPSVYGIQHGQKKFSSPPVEPARGVLLGRGVTLGTYHSACLRDVRNSRTDVLV